MFNTKRCLMFFQMTSLKKVDFITFIEYLLQNNLKLNSTIKFFLQVKASNIKIESCEEDQFICWDGTCLPQKVRCNNIKECPDGSDEVECSKMKF